MPKEQIELTATIQRIIFRKDDSTFTIAKAEVLAADDDRFTDTISVLGNAPSSGLTEGMIYLFRGTWQENEQFGRQFRFDSAIEKQASTRNGVVAYLLRYAPYVGERTAHSLVDQFGPDRAIDELKAFPEKVAASTKGLTAARAREAANALIAAEKFQETRVRMLDLLANRGFGEAAIDAAIQNWGVRAPDVIKRDPFKLMLAKKPKVSGAGFLRCDQLWHAFGLNPDGMKRQVMAAWYHLKSDQSGSTWHAKEDVIRTIKSLITGTARPDRALQIALRAGLLSQCERGGKLWVADAKKAADEQEVAERVLELIAP
jgi:ATP-dependent exoDNAse (exonuclease V) alpha subunit